MANQIFIPEVNKEYTVAEDVTILLYPFNDHPDKSICVDTFYAKYAKKQLVTTQKVETIPLQGNEHYFTSHHVNNMTVVDWYLVTDKTIPESIMSLVKTPMDLAKLDPEGQVYLEIEEQIQWTHRNFVTFSKTEVGRESMFVNPRKTKERIVSNIKPIPAQPFEVLNNTKAWLKAQEINPVLTAEKGNYIPVNYTVVKGSKFVLTHMDIKLLTGKKLFGFGIEINGNFLKLFADDLTKFVIE